MGVIYSPSIFYRFGTRDVPKRNDVGGTRVLTLHCVTFPRLSPFLFPEVPLGPRPSHAPGLRTEKVETVVTHLDSDGPSPTTRDCKYLKYLFVWVSTIYLLYSRHYSLLSLLSEIFLSHPCPLSGTQVRTEGNKGALLISS